MQIDLEIAHDRIKKLEFELARQKTYNQKHIENYDLIENIICESTTNISKNFGANLDILKKVCNRIERLDPDGIVADDVIAATNSMHEYISILQCEDRLFQILNGISSVMDSSIQKVKDLDIQLSYEDKYNFQQELISHYTIQEQRDIANNTQTDTVEQHKSAGTLELF